MPRATPLQHRLPRFGDEQVLGAATLRDLAGAIRNGGIASADLVNDALAAAAAGEGPRAFTRVYATAARASARAADAERRAGRAPPPLSGIPISIKDSFDVAHEVTSAGSIALRLCGAPRRDAAVVARLRRAGAAIVGRTNMSELGVSGLGLNPHHGTPRNPFDRGAGRIPGGSSSGAAVSVSDGMAAAAVCSDTGGSARVPAALCGLVGFKPTAGRIPRDGMIPLAPSYDTVGVLAPSVDCCALLDAVLADAPAARPAPLPLQGLVLGVPGTLLLEALDRSVATAFQRALAALSAAGAVIVERPLPALGAIDYMGISGGIVAAEAYRRHGPLLARHVSLFDAETLAVLRTGAEVSALEYLRLRRRRSRAAAALEHALRRYDCLLMPTAPVIAPALHSVAGGGVQAALMNARLLRNPSLVNFLGWCALTLPCHAPGEAPVGLTVAARHGCDAMLLAVGAAMETCLASAVREAWAHHRLRWSGAARLARGNAVVRRRRLVRRIPLPKLSTRRAVAPERVRRGARGRGRAPMRETSKPNRSAVDLHARLDAMPVSELARVRAKAQLERAEYVAELVARAVSAARALLREAIVRPIRLALARIHP